MRYRNASSSARVWPHLTNAETGRTLDLRPGDDAVVDLPEGFSDPHLVAVPEPPAPVAETPSCDPEPATQEPTPKRRVKE